MPAFGRDADTPGIRSASPAARDRLGRRGALLIATADYADPQFARLRQPVSGVAELAAALGSPQACGFATQVLTNGSQAEVWVAVAGFLAGRTADETVLLYLSCHAIKDRSRTYFAAANTVFRYPQRSGIPVDDVTAELARCGAGNRVLILDCCFSGGFADEKSDLDLAAELALEDRGIAVLAASRAREYSYEGLPLSAPPARSVFTEGLAEGLVTGAADVDGDGVITIAEAYSYAYGHVHRHQPGQAPQYAFDDRQGKIVLALAARPHGVRLADQDTRGGTASTPPGAHSATFGGVTLGSATLDNATFGGVTLGSATLGSVTLGEASPYAASTARHDVRVPSPATANETAANETAPNQTAPNQTPAYQTPAGQDAPRPADADLVEQDRYDAYCVAFSPDSRYLASGGWGRPVRIRDTVDGSLLRELKSAGTAVYDLAFSPDGTLLATGSRDGTVALSEVATGKKIRSRKPSNVPVRALAFSADGALLASAHEDGALRLWDSAALGRPRELKTGGESIYGTTVSPDGKLAAAACADGTIRVWHVPDGKLVASIKCHTGWATAVAFTPDGSLLASAGADGTIVLHDALSGAQVGTRPAGEGIVNAIALTRDGTLLAAGYETGSMAVWELSTGNHTPLRGHAGFVNGVAFSPDGRLLASAGKDGTVRLWR